MLPEKWKLTQLKNIANVTSSKRIFAHDYVKSGIPFYRSKEIILKSENRNINNEIFISKEKYLELKDKFGAPQENEILISSVGTIGKIYLVSKNDEFYFKDGNLLWIKDLNNIYPSFLAISMKGDKFQKKIIDTTGGSSQRALTIEKLEQLYFPLPPLPEQKKIAAILSTWDRAIEGTEKLLSNSQQQKKAFMQQLLTGKKRLPGFTGEWRKHKLGEITTFMKGKGLSKADISPEGETPCIHYGSLFTEQPATIIETKTLTHTFKGAIFSKRNDVLMPTSDVTPAGLAVASAIEKDNVLLGNDILIIRPKSERLYGPFLSRVIRNSKTQILSLATGTTVFHLYASDMKDFHFLMPPLPEQKTIAAVLTTADEELAAIESDLSRLRQEKKALMQQLLTGKRRVTVD
ncbi:restriction endonuclease subunit S [Gluconobacter japonicus]|nr:restriction endonuclease subunit S [Gluconobacter japonicus]